MRLTCSRGERGQPVQPAATDEDHVYACICHGVTEREVAGHVSVGADTVDKVGDSCLAGTGCGTCHSTIERIIGHAGTRACVLDALRGEPISA